MMSGSELTTAGGSVGACRTVTNLKQHHILLGFVEMEFHTCSFPASTIEQVHSALRSESVDEEERQGTTPSVSRGRGKHARQGASRMPRRLHFSLPAARVLWMTLLAVIGETSCGSATAGGQGAERDHKTPAAFDSGYDMARQNMIEAIAELYKEEIKRQEEMSMEDAILCDNGPKEISIFCHGAPEVRIVDLAQDHRKNNECLILNINAPEVSSKIVLKCDGSMGSDEVRWGEDW